MGMVILDPRSRSRSRHSLSELVCEPRKQASSKCPTKKNEISGAHFFFRGRWEIANRNSRNLHDTQKPDKNGCRAVWMHSCTKPVLRRTSGGAAPESNCVPFHTPIPGRADPEQARQATSSINAADTRRDAVGDLSEGWRGDRLVRWLEEPKHLSTFFLFFFVGCSCGSVGVGLQTQDYCVVTSTTQKSHNLESSIQSRSVAALLLESG